MLNTRSEENVVKDHVLLAPFYVQIIAAVAVGKDVLKARPQATFKQSVNIIDFIKTRINSKCLCELIQIIY